MESGAWGLVFLPQISGACMGFGGFEREGLVLKEGGGKECGAWPGVFAPD